MATNANQTSTGSSVDDLRVIKSFQPRYVPGTPGPIIRQHEGNIWSVTDVSRTATKYFKRNGSPFPPVAVSTETRDGSESFSFWVGDYKGNFVNPSDTYEEAVASAKFRWRNEMIEKLPDGIWSWTDIYTKRTTYRQLKRDLPSYAEDPTCSFMLQTSVAAARIDAANFWNYEWQDYFGPEAATIGELQSANGN